MSLSQVQIYNINSWQTVTGPLFKWEPVVSVVLCLIERNKKSMGKMKTFFYLCKWFSNSSISFIAWISRAARTSYKRSCTGFVNSLPHKNWKLWRRKGLIRQIELESSKVSRLKNEGFKLILVALEMQYLVTLWHIIIIIQLRNSGRIKMVAWDSHGTAKQQNGNSKGKDRKETFLIACVQEQWFRTLTLFVRPVGPEFEH